jgi:hypothetical protein
MRTVTEYRKHAENGTCWRSHTMEKYSDRKKNGWAKSRKIM